MRQTSRLSGQPCVSSISFYRFQIEEDEERDVDDKKTGAHRESALPPVGRGGTHTTVSNVSTSKIPDVSSSDDDMFPQLPQHKPGKAPSTTSLKSHSKSVS
jgi:hypothetical protein